MATMRKKNKAKKMKLSERVQPRPQEESLAEIALPDSPSAAQPSTNQPVKSSTAAAKASVERDNTSAAIKLMDASTDAQEDAIEVDKKLLKAVSDLTKTMEFGYKRKEEEKKTGLGGYVQGKIASVKNAFTLEGMAGMAGIQRDSGTLGGAVLGSVLERKEKKKEEEAKKTEFIAKFGEFTERGRQLKETGGMKAVTAEGEERYTKLTAAEKDIAELEDKQKTAKMFGGNLSKSDTEKLVSAQNMKKQVTDYSAAKKPLGGESQEDLLEGVVEGIKEEISKLIPEEREALNKAEPEYLKGVFEGALGSLTEVNEKQLEQLIALVKASTISEEDKMESKGKQSMLTSIQDPKEDKKKEGGEEGGNMMETLGDTLDVVGDVMDMFGKKGKGAGKLLKTVKGVLPKNAGGIGKTLSKMVPKSTGGIGKTLSGMVPKGAAGAAGGAAGKAIPLLAAGASVYGGISDLAEGKKVESLGDIVPEGMNMLNPFDWAMRGGMYAGEKVNKGFESLVGDSIGGKVYEGIDAISSLWGGSDAQRAKESEDAARKEIAARKAAMAAKKAMTPVAPAAAMVTEVVPEKLETPNRVAQAVELAQNKEELDMAEKEKKEAVSQPIVTNAPTTIVNNSSTTMVRPPIRNTDASYNNRLERNFV